MSAAVGRASIAVAHHGTGNVRSLVRALERAGADVTVATGPDQLAGVDGVVLPGVGAFPAGMEALSRLGLDRGLIEVAASGTPLLGVCLGMQMLFDWSDEHGGAAGLGLLPGHVRRLDPGGERLPHIGWCGVSWLRDHPLNEGIRNPSPMYHVHSYAADVSDQADVLAMATHGTQFTTAVARANILGVQFHPEKSSLEGLELLGSFVGICADGSVL